MAILDHGLRYLEVNDALARMNRTPAAAHLGKTIFDVLPALEPVIGPILQKVLASGEPAVNVRVVGEVPDRSGEVQHRIVSYFPIRGSGHTIRAIGIIAVDATEHNADTARLSEAQRSAIVDHALDCIISMDHRGKVVEFNSAAEQTFGYSRDAALGRELADLIIPPPMRAQHRAGLARHLAEGRTALLNRRIEVAAIRADGKEFPVELTVIRVPSDGPPLFTGFIRDITARKQAEQALRTRVRQEETVAQLGLLALGDLAIDALMERCTVLVSQSLDVEYCKIVELLPGGTMLRLRAGVGWKDGLVGRVTEPAGLGSHAGYTLQAASPTIADDLRTETRFERSPLLATHDVVSGIDVVIHGKEAPFGVLGAHTTRRRTFTGDDVNFLQAMANVIAAALENRRAAEGLRVLSRRLVETQEEVQRSIARDLHDEIGQALTALKLVLNMARRQPADDERSELGDAQELVNELIARTRQLSLNLRPTVLDDLGLLPAVRHHLERYTSATGIQVRLEHSGVEGRRFGAPVETAAYRIVQEALTNIARHAQIGAATVRLWTAGGTLGIAIEDKGGGFDTAGALGPKQSSGLIGMRERALLLGGRFTVDSALGAGTRIIAEIPCGKSG